MKFNHYLKKVEESKEFSKFIKKNPKAYLAAGFFVLDYESGQNMHQIDYSLPDNKVATFIIDPEKGIQYKISETALKKKLPKIKPGIETDLESLKGIVEDEMKNKIVTEKIRKMIAILHIMDNKLIWNLQCILSGLEILIIHVDDSDQTILKFEKHSLMELLKPTGGLQMMPKKSGKAPGKKMTTADLEKLEQQLKKIKEKVKKK